MLSLQITDQQNKLKNKSENVVFNQENSRKSKKCC
jgi:hypothetical protein